MAKHRTLTRKAYAFFMLSILLFIAVISIVWRAVGGGSTGMMVLLVIAVVASIAINIFLSKTAMFFSIAMYGLVWSALGGGTGITLFLIFAIVVTIVGNIYVSKKKEQQSLR